MVRVTISNRDTADTAIRVKSLLDPSLHLQPFSLTSVTVPLGTEVESGKCTELTELKVNYEHIILIKIHSLIECNLKLYRGPSITFYIKRSFTF